MLSNNEIIDQIKSGAVGVLPTDTIYGVVCSALLPESVAKLYGLKSRTNKTGTVLAASVDQLVELGIQRRYLKAVEHFWPNSISIEMPVGENLSYIHNGLHRFAVRIPASAEIRNYLELTGPLLTSSANQPGEPPAVTINEAREYFGDDVDFYVDGGSLAENKPSTVIKIVDDAIEVVRLGAVNITEYGEIVE